MVLGHYWAVMVDTWWYWVSIGQYWLVLGGTMLAWSGTGSYMIVLGQYGTILVGT